MQRVTATTGRPTDVFVLPAALVVMAEILRYRIAAAGEEKVYATHSLSEFLEVNKIGVGQTVFFVNRVFVPCPKGAVLTKTVKIINLHAAH